jgi:nitrous oxidase accessory protein NosD
MQIHDRFRRPALALVLLALTAPAAGAADWCVSASGKGSCSTSINAAVTAAAPGDTIRVAPGTYREDVIVTKPIALIGQNAESTIIDATGKLNGVTIRSTSHVVVSGFTVENADTAGIWITNASDVTISDNRVMNNDVGLVPGAPGTDATCPALAGTPFERGEGEDCGEGVFLSAVDHSIVSNNLITGNAGGILVTDDTGPTHDNLITSNRVVRNTQLDCGITLPSHNPISGGVYHNTVAGNDSSYNGGPGVGIFAPIPGSKAYGNVVINNRLRGNGLPGVTMHNHVPNGTPGFPPFPAVFDDNMIIGNDISANSQDFEDAATSGPTGINIYTTAPMHGTVISQNTIHEESLDVVIKGPATVQVHLNNLPGTVGLQNVSSPAVDATQNWWGCATGPGTGGCSSVVGPNVIFTPWLKSPFQSGGGQ